MPIRSFFVIFLRIVAFAVSAMAVCQPSAAQFEPKAEVALECDYVHSNAPPSGCGCFSMNGGSASAAFQLHGDRLRLASSAERTPATSHRAAKISP